MPEDAATATKADIEALTKTVQSGFESMNGRFDRVDEHFDLMLGYVSKHAERIQTLEERLGIASVS